MKELTVMLYGEQTNNAVIKLPAREYPGVLVQGDTLKNLLDTGELVASLAKQQRNDDLANEAEGLVEMLRDIYQVYVQELGEKI
ncbi:conserved hypothetical protein [Candidatus Nitrotoga sp. HW29]|uniref:DUF6959 family protein n=1 Tax=Candidatus Nitrotoga sp. HW29 TaxID=2886963 RepID=UPI001EF3911E|nr:hypothetical protein [Candidatus Nitrotoga sp. HW29]CAH1903828.1 conserved hypothetical protein [Candidatus Nitrotoga sp. HW29]